MVRLLAVRASIVALKRAISLSLRLKPATWQMCSIFSATLFLISAWSLLDAQRQRTKSGASTLLPQIAVLERHRIAISAQPFSGSVTGTGFMPGRVFLDPSSFTSDQAQAGTIHPHLFIRKDVSGSAPASTAKPLISAHTFAGVLRHDLAPFAPLTALSPHAKSLSVASPFLVQLFPDLPSPEKFFRQPPTVIYQAASEGGTSLGKELIYWVQIFGTGCTVLMAFTAQVLMWIGLHRKRVEGTLLRLEIEKRRLEIEQLKIALEKARSKSG